MPDYSTASAIGFPMLVVVCLVLYLRFKAEQRCAAMWCRRWDDCQDDVRDLKQYREVCTEVKRRNAVHEAEFLYEAETANSETKIEKE